MSRSTIVVLTLAAGLSACRDDRKPVPEESPPAETTSPRPAPAGLGTSAAPAPGSSAASTAKGGVMLKVGEQAPDFKAKDHTGKERTLAEFRGKRVVLWFYPKASTGG